MNMPNDKKDKFLSEPFNWEYSGIEKKEYRLEQYISIPKNLEHFKFDNNNHLFLAPELPAWFTCNSYGARTLTYLKGGDRKVSDLIKFLISTEGLNEKEARVEIGQVLTDISDAEFIEQKASQGDKNYLTLHLYLTEKCNLHCNHCYMNSNQNSVHGLSRNQLHNLIKEFSRATKNLDMAKVTFSGGEPLLRQDTLLYLGELSRDLGLYTNLITNGTLINEKNAELISNAFNSVKVSIDGPNARIHEKIRGKGSFDLAVNALKLLDEFEIDKMVAMTILPEDIDEIDKNIESFIGGLSLRKLYATLSMELFKTGRGSFYEVSLENYERAERLLMKIIERIWKKGWVRDANTPMFRNLRNCGIGSVIAVRADGSVMPCVLPYTDYGNIKKLSLEYFLNEFDLLREKTNIDNISECRKCSLRHICLGGCRMENMQLRGSFIRTNCNEEVKNRKLKELFYKPSLSLREIK
jgi:radical SAM protein with 4Fe4S-binding SPASM domain